MINLLRGVFLVGIMFLLCSFKSPKDTLRNGLLEKGVELAEEMLDLVTWEKGRHVVSVYPAGGYSPRTGIEVGIMPVWRINPRSAALKRPTTLAASFQMSTKGMYETKVDLVSYLRNKWMLWSKVQYLFLPDEFYGLGNGSKVKPYTQYELNTFTFTLDVARGFGKNWYIGCRLDINRNVHNNIEGGLLNNMIPGYNGGWTDGIGPMLVFDNRGDVIYPDNGWLVMGSHLWFGKLFGRDYDFSVSRVDVRNYLTLVKGKSVLASQMVFNSANGDVPFFKMPGVGGKYMLRGIPHPYKYIDKKAWYVQTELRQQLWWRVGAVVFAGCGKVMPELQSPWFNNLHVVGGAGLRFRALPDDGLNFRMDYGFSNHNESGIFFTIREAF